MKIGNHEVIHNENRTTFLPIYDLDGVCQDCIYLEKIKPLFEEKDKEIKRLNNIIIEIENRIVMKTNSDFIDTKVKDVCCELYQILQELKGDSSNE